MSEKTEEVSAVKYSRLQALVRRRGATTNTHQHASRLRAKGKNGH